MRLIRYLIAKPIILLLCKQVFSLKQTNQGHPVTGGPAALGGLSIQFLEQADTVDEAGLLAETAKAADVVDGLVFWGFTCHSVIAVVKGLLDLLGVLVAVQLVVGAAEHS